MNVRPQTKDKRPRVNFQWDDPFMLDEQLTEDERMIRDTARAYAQTSCCRASPRPTWKKRSIATSSTRWANSADRHYAAGGIWLRQCELRRLWPRGARDRARRFRLSFDELVQSSLVMHPIYAYGDENQRKKYLPKLATGEWSAASA